MKNVEFFSAHISRDLIDFHQFISMPEIENFIDENNIFDHGKLLMKIKKLLSTLLIKLILVLMEKFIMFL